MILDCSCNMVRRSARKVTQFYEISLRDAGIKPTQFSILGALANLGPVPLTLLADNLLLDRTGLTRNLNVLERNGWIQVETGYKDSRQRVASLTDKGYQQLDFALPYWEAAQSAIQGKLGRDTLSRLKKNLNEMTKTVTE